MIVCNRSRIDLTDIDSQVSKLLHHAAYHEQRSYVFNTDTAAESIGPQHWHLLYTYTVIVYEAHAQNTFYYSGTVSTSAVFGLLAVLALLQLNMPIQLVE